MTEDDRVELLDGKIIEMSPAGKRHAAMVKRLNAMFSKLLEGKAVISVQDPIIASRYSMPQPDLAILKYRADFYEEALPRSTDVLLVIEVADSTLLKDQKIKLPLYATAGIPEYWIINLEANEVEVYREPAKGEYRFREVSGSGGRIVVKALEISIPTGELFV